MYKKILPLILICILSLSACSSENESQALITAAHDALMPPVDEALSKQEERITALEGLLADYKETASDYAEQLAGMEQQLTALNEGLDAQDKGQSEITDALSRQEALLAVLLSPTPVPQGVESNGDESLGDSEAFYAYDSGVSCQYVTDRSFSAAELAIQNGEFVEINSGDLLYLDNIYSTEGKERVQISLIESGNPDRCKLQIGSVTCDPYAATTGRLFAANFGTDSVYIFVQCYMESPLYTENTFTYHGFVYSIGDGDERVNWIYGFAASKIYGITDNYISVGFEEIGTDGKPIYQKSKYVLCPYAGLNPEFNLWYAHMYRVPEDCTPVGKSGIVREPLYLYDRCCQNATSVLVSRDGFTRAFVIAQDPYGMLLIIDPDTGVRGWFNTNENHIYDYVDFLYE